jgi:phosphatidylglycerophosphate synthase
MLEKYLKKHSEEFAIPFIKICILLRIKPNILSIVGLLVILIGAYFFFTVNRLHGVVFIFLGSAIDGLDGPLARTLNLQSDKGALLDSTIDRIGELIIWSVICINYVDTDLELFTVISIITASGLIPYLRAKGESHNIDNKIGITPRPERVIFAVLYMYFEFSFTFVYIFACLTWITVLQRFYKLYQSIE